MGAGRQDEYKFKERVCDFNLSNGRYNAEVEHEAVTTEAAEKPGALRKTTGTWQELHVCFGIVTRHPGVDVLVRNPAETTSKPGCWRTEYYNYMKNPTPE